MLIAAIVIYRPSRISRTATTMAMSWLFLCLCSAIFGYTQVNFQFYCYSVNQVLTVFLFILLLAICLEYDQRSRGLDEAHGGGPHIKVLGHVPPVAGTIH